MCEQHTCTGCVPVAIVDIITELFCKIDDAKTDAPHHNQQALSPSEPVTIGMLFGMKGVGSKYFYIRLSEDYKGVFPQLPSRARLFRRLKTRRATNATFALPPTALLHSPALFLHSF